MSSLLSSVVQMTGASFGQQVGTAVARQQLASQRAVADLVAQGAATAASAAPAGQGKVLDIRA